MSTIIGVVIFIGLIYWIFFAKGGGCCSGNSHGHKNKKNDL
ncbi:hypothetical protein [Natronospora cellulosivora (SeqCode)]